MREKFRFFKSKKKIIESREQLLRSGYCDDWVLKKTKEFVKYWKQKKEYRRIANRLIMSYYRAKEKSES